MNELIQEGLTVKEIAIDWLLSSGLQIVLIIAVAFFGYRIASFTIKKTIKRLITGGGSGVEEVRREETLVDVIITALQIVVWIVTMLMILNEIGIEVGPIIAAAGIVGIAVGFGGQYLVRDLITGFFIVFENQYRVGDVVCIGDKCGLVESLNLRLTTLRNLDGTVHYIPNGEVTTASNLTKVHSNVNLDMGVAYETPLEKVIEVVNKVGDDLADDPEFNEMINEAPQFLRVDDFADSAVMVKIVGQVAPGAQWVVTGELRKRLKIAFDKEGIEIPYPHQVEIIKREA